MEQAVQVKTLLDEVAAFVEQVYFPDVVRHRRALRRLDPVRRRRDQLPLRAGLPLDTKSTQFALPGGYIPDGDLGSFRPLARLSATATSEKA